VENTPIETAELATAATPAEAAADKAEKAETALSWPAEIYQLMIKAATIGADHGVELEQFMKGAWKSYMDARPGYAEFLVDQQLRAQLDTLRAAGKLEIC
jgi:hypothetical protein